MSTLKELLREASGDTFLSHNRMAKGGVPSVGVQRVPETRVFPYCLSRTARACGAMRVPILGQEKGLRVSSEEKDMKLYEREETVVVLERPPVSIVQRHPRLATRTVLCLAVTIFCWSSAFVGIRLGLHGYSPTHLALLRYMTASLVLVFLAMVKRMPLPRWRDIPGFALTGLVGIAIYNQGFTPPLFLAHLDAESLHLADER
jgi:hypothetical protein